MKLFLMTWRQSQSYFSLSPHPDSFNSVVLSSFSNSKKAFLCYWPFCNSQHTFGLVPVHVNPTFQAYPQSPTSPPHSWGLNACNSIVCAVVHIYSYHFWINSRLLCFLTEHEEFSVSHLAHYLLCGKLVGVRENST